MSTERKSRVVASLEEAVENVHTYAQSVSRYPKLAGRIKQHPAWYAVQDHAGHWMFGPSKFVGYYRANASDYLASYSRKDGKETEPALSAWFVQVDEETALGRELRGEFIRFAEKFGKSPHLHWRVSVTQEELVARGVSGRHRPAADSAHRIAYDPQICGGRPRIAGTRVRVSDIITALAEGVSAKDILDDYPYLSPDDISAALNYAAKAVDHRVLKAA